MEDYDAKIAVAMEFYAVRGDLRPFVNERVLKRFKELLDERGDYARLARRGSGVKRAWAWGEGSRRSDHRAR